MSPEPLAAQRAYQMLRSDLVSGRYVPGTVLVERVIAQEFGVSVSPVRDAAQRLVGEGLIELAPGGGYRLPVMTPIMLRDLYAWHSHLLRRAVRLPLAHDAAILLLSRSVPDDMNSVAAAATALFRALAMASDNGEHRRALLAANERLHAVRLGEGRVLANLGNELRAVIASTIAGSGSYRFAGILAYHRRRLRRVDKIVEALRR